MLVAAVVCFVIGVCAARSQRCTRKPTVNTSTPRDIDVVDDVARLSGSATGEDREGERSMFVNPLFATSKHPETAVSVTVSSVESVDIG